MLYAQHVAAAESFRIFCSQAAGELRAARQIPPAEPAMQEGAVEDIAAASGVHQRTGGERRLMKRDATGRPDMAA